MSNILTINAGSSSLRVARYEIARGKAACRQDFEASDQPERLHGHLRAILQEDLGQVDAVAHRVVHGGPDLWRPVRVDDEVAARIADASELAPLHNPVAHEMLELARGHFDQSVAHVACFDTGFYRHLPAVASTYAIPRHLNDQYPVRRYGFHGLAHQAMLKGLRAQYSQANQPSRVISLQLGGGCSVTASRDDEAVDTSMGFTPLEGLMMRTRSGDIDAGLVFYLKRKLAVSTDELESMLNHDSGLLGISGETGDMKSLLESDSESAQLAVEVFCYRACKYIAAYTAALGGIDAIVFGGGVGENAAPVREKILQRLGYFGVELDPGLNARARGVLKQVNRPGSPVDVWVVPVDEGALMAEFADGVIFRS